MEELDRLEEPLTETAGPGGLAEERPGERERPGRGRARRPQHDEPSEGVAEESREEAEDFESHGPTDIPAAEDEPSHPESRPNQHPDKPRYMDSAERRTDENSPKTPALTDEDLFFPREPEEPRGPAASRPEPAPRREEHYTAAEVAEHVTADFVESDPVDEAHPGPEAEESDEPERPRRSTEEFDADELDEFAEERVPRFGEDDDAPMPRRDRRNGPRGGPRRRGPMRPGAGRPKPLIQDIFKRGQEVLVQVIKEGIGTKGPTLSTYISIAGRYLVLMPGLNRVGVSRKIADDDQRRRLRDIFHELAPPKGLGFIIRTAGLDKTKKELQRDLEYLSRLWKVVVGRIKRIKAPAEIYQESDMITRTIRDTFTNDIDTIWVDEPSAYEHAKEFLQIVMPRYANRIKLFEQPEPMFHKYGIEDEIARIQMRHVPLPSGGSIVIDQTEALVAIDVNSGNFRADNNAEETAYQMNLVAAKEIARQLRLRDLGGVIVNDFIDMREEKHRRGVERAMREAVKRDRARTKILKISAFGLIEMTRQRIRPSLKRSVYQDCPHCRSTGQVKTCESMSIDVMRMLQLAAHREHIHRVQVKVAEDVANYLLNKKRKEIARLEEAGGILVTVVGQAGVSPETLEFLCYDNNNNEVKFPSFEDTRVRRR
jgi:ribonuclease E